MFSDELEMLIDAAIADGDISEKERAILHKRAQAEGVDVDELDMIVEARIAKIKKAQQEDDEDGDDELVEKETALKTLLQSIDEVAKKEFKDIKGSFWKGTSDVSAHSQRKDAILHVVRNFYIPSNKQEIIELIGYVKPIAKMSTFINNSQNIDRDVIKAYQVRYDEIISKANNLFPGDADIDLAINGPKKEKKGFFGFGKKS